MGKLYDKIKAADAEADRLKGLLDQTSRPVASMQELEKELRAKIALLEG
jgi:hypothetical protein